MNTRKAQLIKPQLIVDEWTPICIAAYSKNEIIVSNWAHEDKGGGLYNYNHMSDRLTKMVSNDYPLVAKMTRNNTVAIVSNYDSQFFKHAISLYNWNNGRLDPELVCSFSHSPRHVTFNQVSNDVIITTCGGMTARPLDDTMKSRWEYKDMKYSGGVCVCTVTETFLSLTFTA